jgi:hypothetical protein
VRSYAVERDGALVLIDPIMPPEELVAGRELRVSLTCSWHVRSAQLLDAPETDELEQRRGFHPDESVLWLPEHRALVFGDSFPGGPISDEWLPEGRTQEDYRAWLVPLLELPVELVLPTHCDPGGRKLLDRVVA